MGIIYNVTHFHRIVSRIIFSKHMQPNKPLSFPYSNPIVYLYFDCDDKTFVLRNSANILSGGDTQDGYDTYFFRVKFGDEKIIRRRVTQTWGSEFFYLGTLDLNFLHSTENKTLTIQIHHFQDGFRHYSFDMSDFDSSVSA